MIVSSAIGVPPSRCSFSKNITGASPFRGIISPKSRALYSRPFSITCEIDAVFPMSAVGSCAKTARSASFPTSIDPRSPSSPTYHAPSIVAARNASIGLIPPCTIIAISQCAANPASCPCAPIVGPPPPFRSPITIACFRSSNAFAIRACATWFHSSSGASTRRRDRGSTTHRGTNRSKCPFSHTFVRAYQ